MTPKEFLKRFPILGGFVMLPAWVPLAMWLVAIISVCLYTQMTTP